MSSIIERIGGFIKAKEISIRAFELSIGASNGSIGRAIAKNKDIGISWLSIIIDKYPDLNTDWLLTGRGNIFATKTPKFLTNSEGKEKSKELGKIRKLQNSLPITEYSQDRKDFDKPIADVTVDKVFKLRTDRLIDRQQIPIYDMEAVAGLVPLFADQYSQSIVEVMETTLIPKCDGGLRIVGDSMYPLLKSGDIVFYKQIHDILNNIVWGEMYLVSFDVDGDEYVSVKYLQKSDIPDHVVLVSYNEHHKPMEIHVSRIRALAFIKASLRLNSLK